MIDESLYGIASNEVSEVVRPLSYTPLPNLPDWFLGIANLRGNIISIIDLEVLWYKKSNNSPKSKLIVLHSENAEPHIAFKVDKFSEIVTFVDDEIKPFNDKNSQHIFGKIKHKSNNINLLNLEEILSTLKVI
jgi:chemotaxis signal transduction protein